MAGKEPTDDEDEQTPEDRAAGQKQLAAALNTIAKRG
jgi:hypothetical protein